MSKATAKLVAARGDFTYEQVAAASGLTANQVKMVEQFTGFCGMEYWLLSVCDVLGISFVEVISLREQDTRELVPALPVLSPPPEQAAMEFL